MGKTFENRGSMNDQTNIRLRKKSNVASIVERRKYNFG